MAGDERWLLPEGVEEILPEKAAAIEDLRRRLLEVMQLRGFRLVQPPLMEFLDSLLTGSGEDLDSQTYKVSDHMSQRTLGIRADLTPQIARIDAHYLHDRQVNRLCYVGPVLRTRPRRPGGARELLQIGAEMFGEPDTRADCEIIETMLELLAASGVGDITVGLGHVGIYRELMDGADLNEELARKVFDVLMRRSIPDMDSLLEKNATTGLEPFRSLLDLHGGGDVLAEAERVLPGTGEITAALNELRAALEFLGSLEAAAAIHIDLAELRGYRYHTGLTYQAYVSGQGSALAEGGRYDRIGSAFGRARAATGFSTNLKSLVGYHRPGDNKASAIMAPPATDAALRAKVQALRAEGEVVVTLMPGEGGESCQGVADRRLEQHDGEWRLVNL